MAERFFAKVDKNGPVPAHMPHLGPCWVWTAYRNVNGYGVMGIGEGRLSDRAHRIAWRLARGAIPDGMHVLHHCDNPPCVRIEHLFLGTQSDNTADMISKQRAVSPPGAPPGELHHNAKLTESVVRAIRAADGLQREIAQRFGTTQTQVSRIRRGVAWRHLM